MVEWVTTWTGVLRNGLSEEVIFEQRHVGRVRRRLSCANCTAYTKALRCEGEEGGWY